jgi:hypothetical protein
MNITNTGGDVDQKILRQAQRVLDATVIKIEDYERPAQLFWSIIYPVLWEVCKGIKRASGILSSREKVDFEQLFDLQSCVRGELQNIFDKTIRDLFEYVISIDTIDSVYFFKGYNQRSRSSLDMSRISKSKTFHLPVGDRVAYAITDPTNSYPKWEKLNIKLIGPDMELPVYAQLHAIDRLIERIGMQEMGERGQTEAFISVWQSVKRGATIRSYNKDTFLLECIFGNQKIGYFTCMVVPGAVLITTFLFLTMDGTPEGRKLQRNLRLRRPDREYLGLDTLDAFLNSDLMHDSELVELMRKCGCGDVFKLKKNVIYSTKPIQIADAMRRYLGLGLNLVDQPES